MTTATVSSYDDIRYQLAFTQRVLNALVADMGCPPSFVQRWRQTVMRVWATNPRLYSNISDQELWAMLGAVESAEFKRTARKYKALGSALNEIYSAEGVGE